MTEAREQVVACARQLIEEALHSAVQVLDRLPQTAHSCLLRSKADTYWEAVHRWAEARPSDAQVAALGELVFELRDEAIEALKRPPSVPPSGGRGPRGTGPLRATIEPLVLVVEDDDDTRAAMRDLLESEGYDVEEARDGRDALDRLLRAPLPTLVLLDLMMPVMDGRSLLIEIAARPELASLPVVVTTASAIDDVTSSLTVPLLRKPLDMDVILRIVQQYAPRLWDEDEPATEQVPVIGAAALAAATRRNGS